MTDSAPVCLVSGGGRGLGLGVARDLLSRGWRVASFSRGTSDAVRSLQAQYDEATFFWREVDACDDAAIETYVRAVADHFGRIDGLVNNAGQNVGQFLNLTRPEQIHNLVTVNLAAVMNLTRLVCRIMLTQASGSIVNIGSISGYRGFAGISVYAATKAGLDGFTRSTAREIGSRFVRINTVAPGLLETDMAKGMPPGEREKMEALTPMGRIGKVDDVLGTIRFFLSDDSAFISGQSLIVDGALTC